jgi:orotidine-5'-phosphate decarboxylase
MKAYGEMAFGHFDADAMTIVPYMGLSSATVLDDWMNKGKGVYVVWVSSNKDGALVQTPIASTLLQEFAMLANRKNIGLVLGATKVDELNAELFASAMGFPLLLPGFGAQGATRSARMDELAKNSPASLFPVSRGLFDFKTLLAQPPSGNVKFSDLVAGQVEANLGKFRFPL